MKLQRKIEVLKTVSQSYLINSNLHYYNYFKMRPTEKVDQ